MVTTFLYAANGCRFITEAEDTSFEEMWPTYYERSNNAIRQVEEAVNHVHDLFTEQGTMALLRQPQARTSIFTSEIPFENDKTTFPCIEIPPPRQSFHGRTETLEAIGAHLNDPTNKNRLRSFAIYGLGGVGKTSTALSFAHYCSENQKYDAIFWIRGETSISLKQSFTKIAYRLELSSPSKNEDHDSNLLLVNNWLRKTSECQPPCHLPVRLTCVPRKTMVTHI